MESGKRGQRQKRGETGAGGEIGSVDYYHRTADEYRQGPWGARGGGAAQPLASCPWPASQSSDPDPGGRWTRLELQYKWYEMFCFPRRWEDASLSSVTN